MLMGHYKEMYDHTSGMGYMLFFDSDTLPGKALIIKKVSNLMPNTNYRFSFWANANSIYTGGIWFPNLKILINDEVVANNILVDKALVWKTILCRLVFWRQY